MDHVYGAGTKLTVNTNSRCKLDDYFAPFLPTSCDKSITLKPNGLMMFVHNKDKITPRAASSLDLRRIPPIMDVTPCLEAIQRCHTTELLCTELEQRPYGECILSDINTSGLPIQCIARSILYTMAMRRMGYDVYLLRNDSHALAIAYTVSGMSVFVECCCSLVAPMGIRTPIVDESFVRFYQLFQKVQRHYGAVRSEQMLRNFVSQHTT
jgi:hypothetical protein